MDDHSDAWLFHNERIPVLVAEVKRLLELVRLREWESASYRAEHADALELAKLQRDESQDAVEELQEMVSTLEVECNSLNGRLMHRVEELERRVARVVSGHEHCLDKRTALAIRVTELTAERDKLINDRDSELESAADEVTDAHNAERAAKHQLATLRTAAERACNWFEGGESVEDVAYHMRRVRKALDSIATAEQPTAAHYPAAPVDTLIEVALMALEWLRRDENLQELYHELGQTLDYVRAAREPKL
jgi:vacuolar-type H+-ATPase subunit D/Vma8